MASIREEAELRLDKLLRREEGAVGEGSGPAGATDLLRASQRIWEDWQRRIDDRVKHVAESVLGNLPALGRDMQGLVQRLEALEKKLDELEKK